MHRLVPQFILENYRAQNFGGSFDAVCLLADISGFSQMTDVLAGYGLHGSEVLANGMRQVFDPMITSVLEYGGYLVGFAGDAITALFPISESLEAAYTAAIASALSIQINRKDHLEFITPYGRFNISVKIGLGAGEASWKIVTATNGQRATYYFLGSAVDSAVMSLNMSKPGDVIVCAEANRILRHVIKGTQLGECFLLEEFSGKLPKPNEINIPAPNPDHLRVFCTDEVSSHDLTGEFRPAVNLFIGIPIESQRENILESFLQKVFSLQDIYGGLFSRVDVGDKGTNLLMFWGAPIAQENDVERALNFLLELFKVANIPLRAGITHLLAYAGYVGGSLQEEYTCYGWGVNLAARLMMAARPAEIWTDEEFARRAGRYFSFQYAGQQKLKGFSAEQNVFKLIKRKEDDRAVFNGEFVGRETELEMLGRFVAPVWNGQFAGLLTVVGEPGIGKSRLIDAFQASPVFTGKKFYWALCQADEIVRHSLNPFRYWLKRYFHISETMDEAESKQVFDEKLDEIIASIPDEELSQSLNRTRSFLGDLVDLHWLDSLYEKIDAQGRYDNTFIALGALLRGESLRQPTIIFIEDAHLLDSDTKAFISYLELVLVANPDRHHPIAIIATSREPSSGIILAKSPTVEITLTEMSRSDISHLAENLLGGKAASKFLETLIQSAEGNPFYIEQIIRYLQEEEKLVNSSNGWQIAREETLESLPTDISVILISRLDRLNREVKEVVQTASVLGREFELRLLSKMLHDDQALPDKIQRAVKADIFSLLTEIRYIFRHALVRDAAYNMQLKARQEQLHHIAVEAFETLYKEQLSPHYSEIAYHADHAGLRAKAKEYYILAGGEVAQSYKNNLAIESYTRALALSSKDNLQEQIELLLKRVALHRIIGDRAGQEQDLATLEFLADKQKNSRNRAIIALRQAELALDMGDFQGSYDLAQRAIEISNSDKALDIAANAYKILPLALARQGHIRQAIQAGQTGLQLTQQVGDRESEGQILNQLGLIALEQREFKEARIFFEKSLQIAQEIGNRRLEAQVYNNMGAMSGNIERDYTTAKLFFERTLEIVQEMGNRIGESFAFGNLGWTTSMQGDFEQARIYQAESLKVSRETGNRYQETFTLINMSAMMIILENHFEASTYARQALDLASELKDRSLEAWALTFLGHAQLGLREFQEASVAYQQAIEVRGILDQPTLQMEPLAGQAQVELERGQLEEAQTYVEKILTHIDNGGSLEGTEEPLRIYLTMYQTLSANHDPRARKILEAAYSLLKEQVQRIQEERYKETFVRNVSWRREIQERWQEFHKNEQQSD
jgi:predicted ATPase/class 3 adenylate cyclase